jgi:demethylmenaquinone methyltransferase/2-methoxy-6-polyprenyl-1,4-benzoquinol methylase
VTDFATAKEKYVHGVFAAIARRYDLMNTLLSFNRDKYWRRFAVARTGLAAGGGRLTCAAARGCWRWSWRERPARTDG